MVYYANSDFTGKWSDNWLKINTDIQNKSIFKYDYILVTSSEKKPEKILPIFENFKEVKRFYDRKKKKSVVIYKKSTI
jgi:hypothetical protein